MIFKSPKIILHSESNLLEEGKNNLYFKKGDGDDKDSDSPLGTTENNPDNLEYVPIGGSSVEFREFYSSRPSSEVATNIYEYQDIFNLRTNGYNYIEQRPEMFVIDKEVTERSGETPLDAVVVNTVGNQINFTELLNETDNKDRQVHIAALPENEIYGQLNADGSGFAEVNFSKIPLVEEGKPQSISLIIPEGYSAIVTDSGINVLNQEGKKTHQYNINASPEVLQQIVDDAKVMNKGMQTYFERVGVQANRNNGNYVNSTISDVAGEVGGLIRKKPEEMATALMDRYGISPSIRVYSSSKASNENDLGGVSNNSQQAAYFRDGDEEYTIIYKDGNQYKTVAGDEVISNSEIEAGDSKYKLYDQIPNGAELIDKNHNDIIVNVARKGGAASYTFAVSDDDVALAEQNGYQIQQQTARNGYYGVGLQSSNGSDEGIPMVSVPDIAPNTNSEGEVIDGFHMQDNKFKSSTNRNVRLVVDATIQYNLEPETTTRIYEIGGLKSYPIQTEVDNSPTDDISETGFSKFKLTVNPPSGEQSGTSRSANESITLSLSSGYINGANIMGNGALTYDPRSLQSVDAGNRTTGAYKAYFSDGEKAGEAKDVIMTNFQLSSVGTARQSNPYYSDAYTDAESTIIRNKFRTEVRSYAQEKYNVLISQNPNATEAEISAAISPFHSQENYHDFMTQLINKEELKSYSPRGTNLGRNDVINFAAQVEFFELESNPQMIMGLGTRDISETIGNNVTSTVRVQENGEFKANLQNNRNSSDISTEFGIFYGGSKASLEIVSAVGKSDNGAVIVAPPNAVRIAILDANINHGEAENIGNADNKDGGINLTSSGDRLFFIDAEGNPINGGISFSYTEGASRGIHNVETYEMQVHDEHSVSLIVDGELVSIDLMDGNGSTFAGPIEGVSREEILENLSSKDRRTVSQYLPEDKKEMLNQRYEILNKPEIEIVSEVDARKAYTQLNKEAQSRRESGGPNAGGTIMQSTVPPAPANNGDAVTAAEANPEVAPKTETTEAGKPDATEAASAEVIQKEVEEVEVINDKTKPTITRIKTREFSGLNAKIDSPAVQPVEVNPIPNPYEAAGLEDSKRTLAAEFVAHEDYSPQQAIDAVNNIQNLADGELEGDANKDAAAEARAELIRALKIEGIDEATANTIANMNGPVAAGIILGGGTAESVVTASIAVLSAESVKQYAPTATVTTNPVDSEPIVTTVYATIASTAPNTTVDRTTTSLDGNNPNNPIKTEGEIKNVYLTNGDDGRKATIITDAGEAIEITGISRREYNNLLNGDLSLLASVDNNGTMNRILNEKNVNGTFEETSEIIVESEIKEARAIAKQKADRVAAVYDLPIEDEIDRLNPIELETKTSFIEVQAEKVTAYVDPLENARIFAAEGGKLSLENFNSAEKIQEGIETFSDKDDTASKAMVELLTIMQERGVYDFSKLQESVGANGDNIFGKETLALLDIDIQTKKAEEILGKIDKTSVDISAQDKADLEEMSKNTKSSLDSMNQEDYNFLTPDGEKGSRAQVEEFKALVNELAKKEGLDLANIKIDDETINKAFTSDRGSAIQK